MTEKRPDPDALLAKVKAEEAKQIRGKLKIFFGAAPGVGKTYAMLEAGRKEGKAGADVVVGYVEPHIRPETQALVLGLDLLPRRQVPYYSSTLQEFDLEAALARDPQLLLVDELAHTNAPGCTHAKRWQDVEQLLQAGITVYTTLNVQHLESLNDIVAQITGVIVRETVPDSVFEAADEVELVDISPDDLVERLREGKIYVPHQAARAIENFFRKGNLIALRELALRRMAERVSAQMEKYRLEHAISDTWPTNERLLVCVGPSPLSSRLIRTTRRIAASLKAPWLAVNVETLKTARISDADRLRLNQNLQLAEQLGAETVTLSGQNLVDEVLAYARNRNVTKIIVGKSLQPRWKEFLRGSFVYELTRQSGDIDVYVISGDPEETPPPVARSALKSRNPANYFWAVLVVAFCTGLGYLMFQHFELVNIVMVYLLGVVAISMRFGRGPSIVASFLSVAAFDFFFVPPLLTFAVADTEYLFTFAVMLATGLVISTLTSRVKAQAELARKRERRIAALYSLSRELAATQDITEIVDAVARHCGTAFDAQVAILLPDQNRRVEVKGGLATNSFTPDEKDRGVAQWVFDHGEKAGYGTMTLPGADALYLPLNVKTGAVGVMGMRPTELGRLLEPDQVHLMEAFAGQAAVAIERANLAAEAERVRVLIESERLRNSLLSAVSHDLRTPLTAIAGASSTLIQGEKNVSPAARRELLESIYDEAESLNHLVSNLLDMTRLEAGGLTVQKEWQSVEELVGAVLNRLSPKLANRPIDTKIPADLPLISVDAILIQQVLLNLFENADKYSPPDRPIEVMASSQARTVTLEVSDHGPGLPPGDEKRVFEKFYRSPTTSSRSGAGLGLTICRGIIELHGGKIWAKNRDGGGTTFGFSLPVEEQPAPLPAEPQPA
ncbi:MAG TPA: sensor histidine kinase KdpD [Gemmataceae bacterium]|nr:sensor histidine kinase KdpD [Gemmataceae bacterium]